MNLVRDVVAARPADDRAVGDQVRQDADGWLYFEARKDDVIISAGYRIGPAEVEYPRKIWFTTELPKTNSGKINRVALRRATPR